MPTETYSKTPPESSSKVLSTIELAKIMLQDVVGESFSLTTKARTDGSNFRKLVCSALGLNPGKGDFKNSPTKWIVDKGCPGIINQLLDTYLITQGLSQGRYNLQIWNRMATSDRVLAEVNGWKILDREIRILLGFHDPVRNIISSIGIFTGPEIVAHLGKISVTTTKKEQMILHREIREKALANKPPILSTPSSQSPDLFSRQEKLANLGKGAYRKDPEPNLLYNISDIAKIAELNLLNKKINQASTKLAGQEIERIMIQSMGYLLDKDETLEGSIPDIRHQLLEVKCQQSDIVDLGRYTPRFAELLPGLLSYSTQDLRYLIVLVSSINIIEGLILLTGKDLTKRDDLHFVSETSWKVQCSFSTEIFQKHPGKVLFISNSKLSYI